MARAKYAAAPAPGTVGTMELYSPPLLLALGNMSDEWRYGSCSMGAKPQRVLAAYVNETTPCAPDAEGGAWAVKSSNECIQHCQKCVPCHYVSYSPEGGDCAWSRSCDLDRSKPLGHATKAVQKGVAVHAGIALGTCGVDGGCRAAMRSSRLLPGGLAPRHRHALQCKRKVGLKVVVLGGSVSCGMGQNTAHQLAPCAASGSVKDGTCKIEAFGARLEERLNARWPCATAPHTVTNLCQRAKGSNFFANWAAAWMSDGSVAPLAEADMVVVETAHNDMSKTEGGVLLSGRLADTPGRSSEELVGYWTELLLRVLLSLPRKPSLLWLTASWRPSPAPPYHLDAEAVHQAVLSHYGVALLSMPSALAIETSKPARKWVQQNYHVDNYGHISAESHRLIAAVVDHHLASLMKTKYARVNAPERALPRLLFTDEARVAAYTSHGQQVTRIDFGRTAKTDSRAAGSSWQQGFPAGVYIAKSVGFRAMEDVPGKPGLVAYAAQRAYVLFRLLQPKCTDTAQLLPAGASGVTSVGYLTSYVRVGSFEAVVLATPARHARVNGMAHGCVCAAEDLSEGSEVRLLASRHIECSAPTGRNVSVYSAAELRWSTPEARQLPPHSAAWCLWLRIESRGSGKIKLLDVTTATATASSMAPETRAAELWLQASTNRSQRGVCDSTSEDELGCNPGMRKGLWSLEVPAQWPLAVGYCLKRCAACAACHHLSISLERTECDWFSECGHIRAVPGEDWRSAPVPK